MKVLIGDTEIWQVVLKDVWDLDARLGLFMYSTQDDKGRLLGIKKKWAQKSSASCPSLYAYIQVYSLSSYRK